MSYHENFCPNAHASNAYDWKCVHQLLRADGETYSRKGLFHPNMIIAEKPETRSQKVTT
jgi:hypothetical protein